MHRRTLLAGTALVGASLLAGCQEEISDMVLDEDDFQSTAEKAEVATGTLDELGYEHVETEEYRIEEEVDVAGETREIEAGNWVTTYLPEGTADTAEAGEFPDELKAEGGAFGILSTPDFTIAGQSVNPVDALEDGELIEAVDDEVDSIGIGDVERTGDDEVTILEEETEVGVFDVEMDFDGETYGGAAYIARVTHENDILVVVGTHVAAVDARDELFELMETVEHPA